MGYAKHEVKEWVVLRYPSWNMIHIWVLQILIFLYQSWQLKQWSLQWSCIMISSPVSFFKLLVDSWNFCYLKYSRLYLCFILIKVNQFYFHFSLKNDWRLPQNQIRQVTKFVSCAHKLASFWKLKHSMEAAFGQTSCISLPWALASLVSLANGECVDLLIV